MICILKTPPAMLTVGAAAAIAAVAAAGEARCTKVVTIHWNDVDKNRSHFDDRPANRKERERRDGS